MNRLKSAVCAVLLALAMTTGSLPVLPATATVCVNAAETSVSLNRKKATIYAGESFTLKVKGATAKTFQSSNSKIAKVTKKGKVTGVAAGTCKIKVTCENGMSYKCTVTVKGYEADEIYEKFLKSVVEINTDYSIGSGFYIDKNTIITNYHVVDNAQKITAILSDGTQTEVTSVLGYDAELDIAILKVKKSGTPLVRNTHGVKTGEKTYVIGSSYGLTSTLSNGIVTTASRKDGGVNYIQTNTAISSGNSGGPLLNQYGEVMGIISMSVQDLDAVTQNLNFAIEISQIDKVDTSKPMTTKEFCSMFSDSGYGSGNNFGSTTAEKLELLYQVILQYGDADTDVDGLYYMGETDSGTGKYFEMLVLEEEPGVVNFCCMDGSSIMYIWPYDSTMTTYRVSCGKYNSNGVKLFTAEIDLDATSYNGKTMHHNGWSYTPENNYTIKDSDKKNMVQKTFVMLNSLLDWMNPILAEVELSLADIGFEAYR